MKAISDYQSQSPRKLGRWRQWVIPALIITYQVLILGGALFLINAAWPNNDKILASYQKKNKPLLIAALNREDLLQLHQAQGALARWDIQGPQQVTRADLAAINAGLALAAELTTNSLVTNIFSAVEVTRTKVTECLLSSNTPAGTNPMAADGRPWVSMNKVTTNTVTTHTASNTLILSKAATIPVEGDLKRVTVRDRAIASARLGSAIEIAQARASKKNIQLTASEEAELQKRLQALPVDQAVFSHSRAFDLFLLLMAFGGLGSAARGMASLARYLGTGQFNPRWMIYYFSNPLVGAVLAIAFYLVLRGGVIKDAQSIDVVNIFGSCALAMIVGMFSDEATKKLEKIAGSLFTDNSGKDSTESKSPFIRNILPTRPSEFELASFLNFEAFATKLKNAPNLANPPINSLLKSVSDLTNSLLQQYQSGPNPPLQNALLEDLNRIVKSKNTDSWAAHYPSDLMPIEKLRQIFPDNNDDNLHLNRLLLASAFPDDLAGWVLSLRGNNFLPDSKVLINETVLTDKEKPVFASSEELLVKLKVNRHQPGDVRIVVSNPGGDSDAVLFTLC